MIKQWICSILINIVQNLWRTVNPFILGSIISQIKFILPYLMGKKYDASNILYLYYWLITYPCYFSLHRQIEAQYLRDIQVCCAIAQLQLIMTLIFDKLSQQLTTLVLWEWRRSLLQDIFQCKWQILKIYINFCFLYTDLVFQLNFVYLNQVRTLVIVFFQLCNLIFALFQFNGVNHKLALMSKIHFICKFMAINTNLSKMIKGFYTFKFQLLGVHIQRLSQQIVSHFNSLLQIQIYNILQFIEIYYQKMNIFKTQASFLVVLILFQICRAVDVVDLAGKFQNYTCLKQNKYSRAIIRAYHSYGAIDVQAAQNIKLSNQAGLATDVYMFPCRGKSADLQVTQLVDYLNGMKANIQQSYYEYQIGTIWLDIQTNPSSGCSWSLGNPETNCQFVKDLISSLQSKGKTVGIYASSYMWTQIFGSKTNCLIFANYPLWYAHYDGKKSFDDYSLNQFGGWKSPTMKQYAGDSSVCGYKLDLSYY